MSSESIPGAPHRTAPSRRVVGLALGVMAAGLAGCPPATDFANGAGGVPIYQAFNFDTLRTWEFLSNAPFTEIDYRLQARQLDGVEEIGGQDVHTIEFQYDCIRNTSEEAGDCADQGLEATVAFTWRISASLGDGVLFHGHGDTTFDPPVKLADAQMLEGDTVSSSSGGIDYTATYVDRIPCPATNFWPDPDSRADCYQIQVDAEGGDSPIAGTWYVANRFMVPAFQPGGSGELDTDGETTGPPTWALVKFSEAE